MNSPRNRPNKASTIIALVVSIVILVLGTALVLTLEPDADTQEPPTDTQSATPDSSDEVDTHDHSDTPAGQLAQDPSLLAGAPEDEAVSWDPEEREAFNQRAEAFVEAFYFRSPEDADDSRDERIRPYVTDRFLDELEPVETEDHPMEEQLIENAVIDSVISTLSSEDNAYANVRLTVTISNDDGDIVYEAPDIDQVTRWVQTEGQWLVDDIQ